MAASTASRTSASLDARDPIAVDREVGHAHLEP